MNLTQAFSILLAICAFGIPEQARAEGMRELKVHLAQANNNSPYAFVRAKFNPREVADPWAVRFFDAQGKEVPYFVWDSITWRVAREGRADWGKRYALLNHGPGDAPQVRDARAQKIEWTKKKLPDLGAKLEAQEQAANQAPDSVCAALYLLRYPVPALGKERLTLRIYPENQVEPKRQQWRVEGRKSPEKADQRVTLKQGALEFRDLPDRLTVIRDGKEILRHAGFQAGGQAETSSHADPSRPSTVEATEGIITKISITAQTKGRQDGVMDWQCSYWLFPEGGFAALEGFSIGDTAGYLGGPQKLSIWQTDGAFNQSRAPSWETPWWVHQAGGHGFVATHLFHATPLTIGFGNNPFAVNAEGPDKDPRVEIVDQKLALTWSHRIDDPAITKVMTPQPLRRPNAPPPKDPPQPVRWKPKIDWLYRQYACGLGEQAETAENALRLVLGAATGWIDRPVSEENLAVLLVQMMPRIASRGESSELGLLKVVPAVLQDDAAAINEALRRARDPVERTEYYINEIRRHVAGGGRPSEGRKKAADGTFHEGWTGNPCYHAALMPCYVRVLEHFELRPERQQAYRDAILRYADFTLDLLGGNPIDYDKLGAVFRTEWPSRIVPVTPLMLHAHTIKPQEKYARTVKVQFQDFMRLVERNPHGYFPVWTWTPKADKYDTVYNPVSYERGLTSLWSEEQLDLIGRDQAARFVAAQARWFVYSGQLLDTLEMDNATAIRASTHGGHTMLRNQIGIYLYDDFDFYRGLVADLVTWSAASCQVPGPTDEYGVGAYRNLELSDAGSSMLRWALAIRPGSKWHESKVRRLPKGGFQLQAWNRKPLAKPTVKVAAKDAGLKGETDVLHVQLNGPAFRLPAEIEVSEKAESVSLKVNQPAKVRLFYPVLRPGWTAKDKMVLRRQGADVVRQDVVWENGYVEWQATPGEYELSMTRK